MANVRQEAVLIIELDGSQIQSFAKLIGAIYELNNPDGFGFQFKKKINFDKDVSELTDELAHLIGIVESDVEE